jgi:two-component system phosphate regulon sensor histidine kinase PhoR
MPWAITSSSSTIRIFAIAAIIEVGTVSAGFTSGENPVNERLAAARALVEHAPGAVLLLDHERQLVAASESALRTLAVEVGRRVPEQLLIGDARPLVLYLDSLPELTAYEELRTGFTAAVSHELRTPLARMLAVLESVGLPETDPNELVEQARQEVEQIRELIDDVLFLGELETGREVVALGATHVLPVLEGVAARLEERAAATDIRIVVRGNELAAVPLRPRMLRVVAENLAENALRYAGAGTTFTLAVERSGDGVVVSATDDGAGVGEADLPRLFERFYRADRARASRGTGLGLAIVKHIVTAAGGAVEASRGPEGGLQIRCTFARAGI